MVNAKFRMSNWWRLGLVLGLLGAALAGAAEIDDLIAGAPAHEKYPEAGALVLLDRTLVTIDRNNNAATERYLVVKIFEDRARDELGDVRQRYNKDGQSCEVLAARTHRPDGTIVEPEAKAIADVSAPEVASAPAYTSAMLKVVSFPALEPGAIMEYRIRVKPRKSRPLPGFSGAVPFGGHEPVLRAELVLELPKGTEFRHGWDSEGPEPLIEEQAATTSYTWTMIDLPQVFREPGSPPLARLVPRLWYSSYADWTGLGNELGRQFRKGLVSDGRTRARAQELAAGRAPSDALREIFLFVTRKITGVNLEFGRAGHEPHKAAQVLDQKYGDCRDKVCLLVTLLSDAGIDASPVAVHNSGLPLKEDVPADAAFNHMICRARIQGQEFWLDPFAEYWPYGYLPDAEQEAPALVLDRAGPMLTSLPALPSEAHRAEVVAEVEVSPDGLLQGRVTGNPIIGVYDQHIRRQWRDQTPVERRRSQEQLAAQLKTGAVIDSLGLSDLFDPTQEIGLGCRYQAERYAARQADRLTLRVPPALIINEGLGLAGTQQRRNPLVTRPPRSFRYVCRIARPAGMKVLALPAPWTGETGTHWASIDWAEEGGTLVFTAAIVVMESEVSAEDYPGLRALADAFYRPELWEVVLTR